MHPADPLSPYHPPCPYSCPPTRLEATVGRLVAQVHDLDGTMALPIEPVVDWLAEQH